MRGLGKDPPAVITEDALPVGRSPVLAPEAVLFTSRDAHQLVSCPLRFLTSGEAPDKGPGRVFPIPGYEGNLPLCRQFTNRTEVDRQSRPFHRPFPLERRGFEKNQPPSLAHPVEKAPVGPGEFAHLPGAVQRLHLPELGNYHCGSRPFQLRLPVPEGILPPALPLRALVIHRVSVPGEITEEGGRRLPLHGEGRLQPPLPLQVDQVRSSHKGHHVSLSQFEGLLSPGCDQRHTPYNDCCQATCKFHKRHATDPRRSRQGIACNLRSSLRRGMIRGLLPPPANCSPAPFLPLTRPSAPSAEFRRPGPPFPRD